MWTSNGYTGGHTWIRSSWEDAYRTADGALIRRTFEPDVFSSSIDIPTLGKDGLSELEWYRLNGIDIRSEEEIPKMELRENRDAASFGRRYAVACSHAPDLAQDRILKCISMMKSKLMMQCAPVRVESIECRMTPAVKDNIVKAYKKLEMYGKKTPFVARFDEYGRRLPDEIKIDVMRGMTIKIIDPSDYGPYHLEFEGIVYDSNFYKPSFDMTYDTEVPF